MKVESKLNLSKSILMIISTTLKEETIVDITTCFFFQYWFHDENKMVHTYEILYKK